MEAHGPFECYSIGKAPCDPYRTIRLSLKHLVAIWPEPVDAEGRSSWRGIHNLWEMGPWIFLSCSIPHLWPAPPHPRFPREDFQSTMGPGGLPQAT